MLVKTNTSKERPALLHHHRVKKTLQGLNLSAISGLVAGSATTGDDLLTMTNSRIVVLIEQQTETEIFLRMTGEQGRAPQKALSAFPRVLVEPDGIEPTT
jgi:hypothetical protein